MDRLSGTDQRIFEPVAGDAMAKYGYQTQPNQLRNSHLEKRYYDMVELKRLFRVNLYHMQNKFPGDTKRKAREAAARR